MNSGSFSEQASLIHASGLPNHSVSNHQGSRSCRFHTLPLSARAFRFRCRVRHWLAGSPTAPGRIEFVILRTGRSPPAALHHASLRCSCIRLQAGERIPGEDLHLSDYSRCSGALAGGNATGSESTIDATLKRVEECAIGIRPFQGRAGVDVLTVGVAHGYSIQPLRG